MKERMKKNKDQSENTETLEVENEFSFYTGTFDTIDKEGDDKSNLFQKFNKLTAKPTDGEDSTGIGLFGVKRNAELIGAEVYCNSKLGEGAEFVFKIKI